MPFVPKRVVFIDDRRANLESVEEALLKENITYVGWEYRGAEFLSTEEITEEHFTEVWSGLINEAKNIIERYFPEQNN
ncbi:DUF2608 domain-containing protein [Simkania negevensis]|uniref:DUF2608 domain-containing protein n=1 Tax=Simkania negevensis TaxID=83561 RepID=A0ABS3AT95_9BACT|nr:DUF2608 domain-containing protein [Simkania negevensis]